MITLLVDPGPHPVDSVPSLPQPEAHHLRVRRGREGEEVELRDGAGWMGKAVVAGDPSRGQIRVIRSETRPRPSPLVLAVGSGDRERFLWLAEKATELGVTDLIPLETELVAGVGTRVRGQHVEKLQRRALEAVKQCGAAWATVVHQPHTIAELLARPPVEVRWLADAEGGTPPVPARDSGLMVAVGPEGGFTPAERARLLDQGFLPVCVGAHTLRFETAAIAAAVLGRASAREATHD